jgi:hypothetical protein
VDRSIRFASPLKEGLVAIAANLLQIPHVATDVPRGQK